MYSRKTALAIIFIVLSVTVFLSYRASLSKFDYDFEKFFPQGDTETQTFEAFRNVFENDYDFLLIALENKEGIFEPEFLKRVESFTHELKKITYVTRVISPTEIKIPIVSGAGISYRKILHPNNSVLLQKDKIRIYETGEFTGSFFSKDTTALCLIVQNKERLSKKKSDVLLKEIENLMQSYGFDKVHLAGKIKAQQVYLQRMQEEILLFLSLAIVLVIILLSVTFQSLWAVTFPILIVLFSIIWQLGIMQILGKKIDILQVLVPTILFVVGMSDVIHILSKYIEELRTGRTKYDAIKKSVKEVGLATFFTSFTTAVGFATLVTSTITPVRDFGLYTSIGVMVAFLLTIVLMPAVMVLAPRPNIITHQKSSYRWNKLLQNLFLFSIKYRWHISLSSLVIAGISVMGMRNLKVNNLLLEDLHPREPLKQEFAYFEQAFSGGRPFEMQVMLKDTSENLWHSKHIRFLEKLEKAATHHFELGFVQSPLTFIRYFHRAVNSGLNTYYRIPDDNDKLDSLLLEMRMLGFLPSDESKRFLSENYSIARISGKMHDVGSYRANSMEKSLMNEIHQWPETQNYQVKITGSARLIDLNISHLSINLIKGLSLAFVIVSVLFGMLFRSWRMILIALIPNIFPLLIIAGWMGFMDINLKVSSSIIFTIAFGIAVDDTIHFLSRFRIELDKGKSKLYALKRSYLSTGKAIFLTTLVLCMGFAGMISSSFQSVFVIGMLTTLTLITALFFDLLLLPFLIITFYQTSSKTQ
ncbi:MAG: MMPL family transporter [Flavobacteriales bacterium]|nr:MMPL family transporter [Flavobacteriales bacterium]